MKKILLLIAVPFVFLLALSAQITQEQADAIVLERLNQETLPYIIHAKEGIQSEMTITTMNGETLELDYSCWVYYVSYPSVNCCLGRYLIVNESNGNLLELKATNDATPEDLNMWRIVKTISCKELKLGEITEFKWDETVCNTQYGLSLSVENINDCRCQIGTMCDWEGYASVEFHLTTQKGQYDFTLDTHQPPIFKNDTIIEGIKYHLADVLPYPVWGEEQEKTVKILVNNNFLSNTEWRITTDFLGRDETVDEYSFSTESFIFEPWGNFVYFSSDGTFCSFDRQECGNSCFTNVYGKYSLPENDKLVISVDSVNINCTGAGGENKTEIRNGSKITFKILNFSTYGFQLQKETETIIPFSATEMTKSVNNFSMNFFATAYEELKSDENIVLSPLSLNMALAMVWNGANGDTRQGIQQAMGMQNYSQAEVNNYFLNLRKELTTVDPDVKLALANSIWYDNGFPVKTDFITVNKNYYDAEVNEIDFRAPDAPDQINQWCSDNTNGLIKKMINAIPDDVVMYLINALYFKGLWADGCAFAPEYTHQSYFYKENGKNISVDMMSQKREDIDYYSDDRLEMVSLPYGNGAYSMVFALPKGSFAEMLLQLKENGYWSSCLSNLKPQEVQLSIPKFKVEYEPEPNLNEILKKLGMEKAFIPFSADFSGISNVELFISQVRQKTFIEVDEKGTEAAAVTIVEGTFTSVPSYPVFFANRPFLFVIQENTTGTALFMGKIGNPK